MPDDQRLPPEAETAQPVPAIDISVIVGCGGERQITLRTAILQETDPDTANRVVDMCFALGDRAKARYDLEKEMEEFHKVGLALTTFLAGLPIAQTNYIEGQEKRRQRIIAAKDEHERLDKEGYDEHVASGRTGTYAAKGSRAATMKRKVEEAKAIADEIKRHAAEAENHLQENLKSIRHYRDDLAQRLEKVNAMRRLAGFGDLANPYETAMTEPLPEHVEVTEA